MAALLLVAFVLHPVHETVAEVEWNDKTTRLEVALRLDVLDEQWLAKAYRKDDAKIEQWSRGYLRQRFRVSSRPKPGEKDNTQYHWVGREVDGAHVWWFFEIEPMDHQRPAWIESSVLQEREANYTHRILILGQSPRRSLTLTIERPKANFDQAKHESDKREERATPAADRRGRFDR